MNVRVAPTIGLVLLVFGAMLFLVATGVPVLESALLLVVVSIQTWGGWMIWRSLRSKGSGIESLGMAIAIGTALSALAGVGLRAIADTTLGWILPAVVGLLLMARQRHQRNPVNTGRAQADFGVWFAAIMGIAAGLGGLVLVSLRSYPLTWSGSWGGYHGDMLFFEAVGSSLAGWGPLSSIFSPDLLIRYHWLVYGWTGFLTDAAGAEPFVVITRVLPVVALIAAVTIAAGWTRRLTSAPWAPFLAVLLVVTGGYVGASYGTILNFDSPSTSLTTVWLMAGTVVVLQKLDGDARRTPSLTIVFLLAAAMSAGKVSTGFVFAATLSLVALFALVRRSPWRSDAIRLLIAGGLGAAGAYVLAVAGSADPGGLDLFSWIDRASSVQGLNPIAGYIGALLGTVILSIAVAARWAGLLWLIRDPVTRWTPTALTGIGLALGGLLPLILLSGGVNETWFALSASAPLSVLSAAGVGRFVSALNAQYGQAARSRLILAGGGAIALWAAIWLLWNTGPSGGNIWEFTLRWAGPIVALLAALMLGVLLTRSIPMPGIMLGLTVLIVVIVAIPGRLLALGPSGVGVQPGTRGDLFGSQATFANGIDQQFIVAWSDSESEAGTWFRAETSGDALIATNHTFSPLVPALANRQTLVSGMHYQAPYGLAGNVETLLRREIESWSFIDSPSIETWAPLCRAGVTHLWVDPRRTSQRSWEPWGDIVTASSDVLLVAIRGEALSSC